MTKGVHLDLHVYLFVRNGEVTERPNVPVLKTGVARATVGSNPTLSATYFARLTNANIQVQMQQLCDRI